MTLGNKIKDLRCRFGLTQEQLAKLIFVSRQAITKWESNYGMPDISNLKELSKLFSVTVDYLLDDNKMLTTAALFVELDKNQYKNVFTMNKKILDDYFDESFKIYSLIREKKKNIVDTLLDIFVCPEISPISTADDLRDLSSYYLVKKENLNLLVNIKNRFLKAVELENLQNSKKFIYENNKFTVMGKLR